MSYARWSEGDVYVYEDVSGGFTCCGCSLHPDNDKEDGPDEVKSINVKTRQEMLAHLDKHVAAGHLVPSRAVERLKREIDAHE